MIEQNNFENKNNGTNYESTKGLKRIDKNYILSEISSVLNFDKGIFYTTRELLIRPGTTVRKFILEDRNRIVKPVIFLIITSLIYTIVAQLFKFEVGYINYNESKETAVSIVFSWIQNNYGYANIIMGILIAFWVKLLFRKRQYNFYEILILLCFVMGIGMLLASVFGVIEGFTGFKVLQYGGLTSFLYISWAIGQFFNKKKIDYFKAIVGYILGVITFASGAMGIGLLIEMVK